MMHNVPNDDPSKNPSLPPIGFVVPPMNQYMPNQPPPYVDHGYPVPPPYVNPGFHHPTPNPYMSPTTDSINGMPSDNVPLDDPEDSKFENFNFSEKTIRRAFIRKVYGILMCQLAVTTGIIALFLYHSGVRLFFMRYPLLRIGIYVVMLVTVICITCFTNIRRKAPMNFIFLGVFTIAESLLLGYMAIRFDSESVIMAAGISAAVCLGITLFAFQTKYDFTVCGGGLFVALIVLLIFGIFALIFPGKVIILVYASLGALLFSLYLVYDTQLMMGGKHKYSLSPEEYVFAALNLYIDIVHIFMYILAIIGFARK